MSSLRSYFLLSEITWDPPRKLENKHLTAGFGYKSILLSLQSNENIKTVFEKQAWSIVPGSYWEVLSYVFHYL